MTIDEMIAVMTAFKEGKDIEFRSKNSEEEWQSTGDPSWVFNKLDYRIKPEPKAIWVNEYHNCSSVHSSQEAAERSANWHCIRVAVKYQEVNCG